MLKTIVLIAGAILGRNFMSQTVTNAQANEVITVGGGLFLVYRSRFEQLKGVEKVESGYSGGAVRSHLRTGLYGDTGHAE